MTIWIIDIQSFESVEQVRVEYAPHEPIATFQNNYLLSQWPHENMRSEWQQLNSALSRDASQLRMAGSLRLSDGGLKL